AMTGAALLVGGLLLVQVALGIGNVLLHLPLGVATAHNGVAALLLVSMIYLNYRLWRQQH
ncbi:MAG: COX15/CtaA family protein, partial [Sedimenticolaceae bacterium]